MTRKRGHGWAASVFAGGGGAGEVGKVVSSAEAKTGQRRVKAVQVEATRRGGVGGLRTDTLDIVLVVDGDRLGVPVRHMMLLGMNLFMLLQILRTLEWLAADLADVGFEWRVDSEMRSDVVALGTCGTAALPFARQTQVVGRLASNVVVAEMDIEQFGVGEGLVAAFPETLVSLVGGRRGRRRRRGGRCCRRGCCVGHAK